MQHADEDIDIQTVEQHDTRHDEYDAEKLVPKGKGAHVPPLPSLYLLPPKLPKYTVACNVKCRVKAHARLRDFDPEWDGVYAWCRRFLVCSTQVHAT